jgi:cytochrome P450
VNREEAGIDRPDGRKADVMQSTLTDVRLFYDPFSFAVYESPFETYRLLRDRAPAYFSAKRDLWVISRYDDVRSALRQPQLFSSRLGDDVDGTHDSYTRGNITALDPPRHTLLRGAIQSVFLMKEIAAKETDIRERANILFDRIVSGGGGDLASEFAVPLAVGTGTRLLGCPTEDDQILNDQFDRAMIRTLGVRGLPPIASEANDETEHYLAELVKHRRRELTAAGDGMDPARDAVSRVAVAVEEGRIDESEAPGLCHLLFSAAIDTVASLMTTCFALLDQWPDLREQLVATPSLIPAMIEETLRYDSPVQNTSRQTTSDAVMGDVVIPNDSRVMLLIGSANRDERAFENPDDFDLTRDQTKKRHLAFADGIHACLGAAMARLMARVALEVVLSRAANYQIVGTPERTTKQMVRGFSKLPISVGS